LVFGMKTTQMQQRRARNKTNTVQADVYAKRISFLCSTYPYRCRCGCCGYCGISLFSWRWSVTRTRDWIHIDVKPIINNIVDIYHPIINSNSADNVNTADRFHKNQEYQIDNYGYSCPQHNANRLVQRGWVNKCMSGRKYTHFTGHKSVWTIVGWRVPSSQEQADN